MAFDHVNGRSTASVSAGATIQASVVLPTQRSALARARATGDGSRCRIRRPPTGSPPSSSNRYTFYAAQLGVVTSVFDRIDPRQGGNDHGIHA